MNEGSAFHPPRDLPTGVLVWWVGLLAGRPLEPSGAADLDLLRDELLSRSTFYAPAYTPLRD